MIIKSPILWLKLLFGPFKRKTTLMNTSRALGNTKNQATQDIGPNDDHKPKH